MEKSIKRIDAQRKRYHDIISEEPWGDKRAYHLCINTTGRNIEALIPSLAEYVKAWFIDTPDPND